MQSIEEVKEQVIEKINGTYLCYLTSAYNFHYVVENRDNNAPLPSTLPIISGKEDSDLVNKGNQRLESIVGEMI